jgi:hypothetical protein
MKSGKLHALLEKHSVFASKSTFLFILHEAFAECHSAEWQTDQAENYNILQMSPYQLDRAQYS